MRSRLSVSNEPIGFTSSRHLGSMWAPRGQQWRQVAFERRRAADRQSSGPRALKMHLTGDEVAAMAAGAYWHPRAPWEEWPRLRLILGAYTHLGEGSRLEGCPPEVLRVIAQKVCPPRLRPKFNEVTDESIQRHFNLRGPGSIMCPRPSFQQLRDDVRRSQDGRTLMFWDAEDAHTFRQMSIAATDLQRPLQRLQFVELRFKMCVDTSVFVHHNCVTLYQNMYDVNDDNELGPVVGICSSDFAEVLQRHSNRLDDALGVAVRTIGEVVDNYDHSGQAFNYHELIDGWDDFDPGEEQVVGLLFDVHAGRFVMSLNGRPGPLMELGDNWQEGFQIGIMDTANPDDRDELQMDRIVLPISVPESILNGLTVEGDSDSVSEGDSDSDSDSLEDN